MSELHRRKEFRVYQPRYLAIFNLRVLPHLAYVRCGCGWRSDSLLRLGYEEEALLPLFDFMFAAIQEASDTQVVVVKPYLQDK
jgi:hypothetical protein